MEPGSFYAGPRAFYTWLGFKIKEVCGSPVELARVIQPFAVHTYVFISRSAWNSFLSVEYCFPSQDSACHS